MAKGNDGNYLQHCIEVELASRLLDESAGKGLQVALTHGMAPFEQFEVSLNTPKPGLSRKFLKRALEKADGPPLATGSDEPLIIQAYRQTGASEKSYPNTAELLSTVIGKDRLSGGITEVDCTKHRKLYRQWSHTGLKPVCSSWRSQVGPGGVLTCPKDLLSPWLFSMDPMSYREKGWADDDQLYQEDLASLSCALGQYATSGNPGVVALFVYNIKPEFRNHFWRFADLLAKNIDASMCAFWLTHRGGNCNLVALLSLGIKLQPGFMPINLNRANISKRSMYADWKT